jgi:predicted TIM-barrel fold metal-dependent hydrolase
MGIGVVDADGHVVERGAELSEHGWSRSTTGHPAVDQMLAVDQVLLAHGLCRDAHPFAAESRLEDMDREGIAISVNYPTALLLVNQLADEIAVELCRAYNSWAYEVFTVPTEGRVLTMALVSLADADAAVCEARRAVRELGAPGIAVSPFAGHRHLDDAALDPLWALAEELDVAVGIHGGRATTAPLLPSESFRDQKRYYAMAHPFGQMMAMGDLAIGGVLARFDRLRVAFLESGIGWVRWYADRLDEAAESVHNQGASTFELDAAPSEYLFSGNCFYSCEPDEPNLPELVRAVGEDVVLFASDYPHFDCDFPESVRALEKNLGDRDVLKRIATANPKRLYNLATP